MSDITLPNGICDSGRTRLDYADKRHPCAKSKSNLGPGTVEATPIGVISDGQRLTGYSREGSAGDPCRPPARRPVGKVC